MNKLLILLLSVFLLANAQTTVQGALGVQTSVAANTQTTINFGLLGTAPSLTITLSQSAQVTLSLFTSLGVNLPRGFSSLSLDVGLGYTLSVSNGSSIVSAYLVTPPLSAASQTQAAAAFRVSCLQFNANTSSFQEVTLNSFSVPTGFNISIPEASTYLFVAVQANATIPNIYGRARRLFNNTRALIQYSENFLLDVTLNATADVTVTFYTTNPAPKNPSQVYVALNVYWTIDINTQASVNSTLSFIYTAAQLAAAGVSATQLRFAFYNTNTAQWEFFNTGGQVDAAAKTVSQFTTHFSTWGVYGDNTTAQATSGATGGQTTQTGQTSQATQTNITSQATQQQSGTITPATTSQPNSGSILVPYVAFIVLLFSYFF